MSINDIDISTHASVFILSKDMRSMIGPMNVHLFIDLLVEFMVYFIVVTPFYSENPMEHQSIK